MYQILRLTNFIAQKISQLRKKFDESSATEIFRYLYQFSEGFRLRDSAVGINSCFVW